jgi:hypothetical protein
VAEDVTPVGWIYVKHAETGGATYIPDEDGVLEWYEGRGWKQTDEPESTPFVPPKGDVPPADDEWVELVHPDVGAIHQFPNNPEALEGAYEAGWQVYKPPTLEDLEKPEKPAKAAKKSASAEPATDNDESKGVTTSG